MKSINCFLKIIANHIIHFCCCVSLFFHCIGNRFGRVFLQLAVAHKDSVPHFGSNEAKLLAEETDVLDLGLDSSVYLSQLDGPRETQTKYAKLNSVVVKPNNTNSRSKSSIRKRENSSHRVDFDKRTHRRIADFNSTNRCHAAQFKVRVDTTSQIAPAKQTETRGTQTDRTGPCKCARVQQQRNQRKRADNQLNKQIVDTLDFIKFTNSL